MRNLLTLFILFFSFVYNINARTLKIVKLNTPTIKIGNNNRVCRIGSTFEDNEEIKWDSPKQDMWAKAISGNSRELMHFSREAFVSKNVKTPSDYFNKINHGSTRGDISLLEGKNKTSFPDKRLALVIGNSNYQYLPSLNNPINDAADVAEKLQSLGFDVYCLYDINYMEFDGIIKKFSYSAKNYDVALVYYSGHGIECDGHNYLIPVNTGIAKADDLFNCVDLDIICFNLSQQKCKAKLIFVDACRTEVPWKNVYESSSKDKVGDVRVVFSTGYNKFAYDGDDTNRNSPFATAFLQNVGNPSPDVYSTINKISKAMIDICQRNGFKGQTVSGYGDESISFTFVDPSSDVSNSEIVVQDVNQLLDMANKGDARAYIPLAEYYLKNAAGITSYEKAHIYAVKAIDANVRVDDAKAIIRKLESLEFYKRSSYNKPNI